MPNKVILAIIVSGLLISGFFYFQIIKEKPEPFYSEREEIKTAKDAAEEGEVLGQETKESELATEAEKEALEQREVRGFEGCRQDQVNINIAFEEGLKELQGIGPVLAQRIIAERQQGLFYSLSDLVRVSGIGEGIAANIKEQDLACAGVLDEGLASFEKEPLIEAEEEKEAAEEFIVQDEEETEEEYIAQDKNICPVDINIASEDDLQNITGIGPVLAQRITEKRPFLSVYDLIIVSGIGEVTLQKIIDQGCAYVEGDAGQQTPIITVSPPEEDTEEKAQEEVKKVEINSAGKEDLELLSGIGPVYAERIIENRPFCSLDELIKVNGIGPVTLENIKEQGIAYVEPLEFCFEEEEPKDREITLVYPSEIKCGEVIEVGVGISNFEDVSYDVKLAIETDADLHFSETFIEEEWKSSFYYLEAAISGPSQEKTFQLRIKEGKDYEGAARILFRVREDGSVVKEKEGEIEVVVCEEESEEGDKEDYNEEEGEDVNEEEFEGCQEGQINLNSASKEDLTKIVEIGSARADQIIELRQEELFWSVNDLARVSGISLGGSRLESIIEQALACAANPY